MKAQELRIGNWVKDHGETGQQWPVSSINQNGFTAGPMEVFPAGMMHDWGIPLTAEWLERLGYKKTNTDGVIEPYWLHDSGIAIFEDAESRDRFYHLSETILVWLANVHTLQNFHFALTGTELELTKA